jgi:hypothetical protein
MEYPIWVLCNKTVSFAINVAVIHDLILLELMFAYREETGMRSFVHDKTKASPYEHRLEIFYTECSRRKAQYSGRS